MTKSQSISAQHFGLYRFPAGYISVDELITKSDWFIRYFREQSRYFGERCMKPRTGGLPDSVTVPSIAGSVLDHVVKTRAPIYRISFDLGASLLRTDFQDSLSLVDFGKDLPFDFITLLVPRHLFEDTDGDSLTFICAGVVTMPETAEKRLSIAYIGDGGMAGHSVSYINTEGVVVPDADIKEFTGDYRIDHRDVLSLVIQSFLILKHAPEYVQSDQGTPHTKGFGDRKLRPRLIDFSVQRTRRESIGMHRSPLAHWRKGHWRKQPCGRNRSESKIIWILPTYIGGMPLQVQEAVSSI